MVAPWGVILLVLYGVACTILGGASIVEHLQVHRERVVMRALTDSLRQTIDSVAALSCRVR